MRDDQLVPANGGGPGDHQPRPPSLSSGPRSLTLDVVQGRGASSEGQSDLVHYWRLLLGRRWLLLAAALLGLSVAAVFTFRQARLYVAQATVEFKQALPPEKDLDILQRGVLIPPELARRLLTTKILAARVINAERTRGDTWFDAPAADDEQGSPLGAARDWVRSTLANGAATARVVLGSAADGGDARKPAEAQAWDGVDLDAIQRYYARVDIKPVRGTSLADIVVTDPDATAAAAVANDHAQAFIEMDIETKVASLSDAQGFLGRQLNEVKAQLEASRKKLSDYQLKYGILSLPKDASTLSRESLRELNRLLTKVQAERIVAEGAYRNAAAMSPQQLGENLPEEGLKNVRTEILSLAARYQANLQDFGKNHPDMVAMRARIDSLRDQLRAAAVQARNSLRAVWEAAQAKENELRGNLEKLGRAASEEDRTLVQFSILQRDVDSNEHLYASLLEQAKQVNVSSAVFNWTNAKLVDRAVAPTVPTYPRTARSLLLGLFLGLAGGVFGCMLIDRLDTSLHTPDDLVSALELPTLGVIPDFNRLAAAASYGRPLVEPHEVNGRGRDLVTLLQPASVVSEAYRSVRTNLMFSSPGGPPRSLLITSSQVGEGKSVTVVNLAVTLALSGARVLVIDADLRKPSCHKALRVARAPGLSDVLTGHSELSEAIVRSPLSPKAPHLQNGHGTYILPAGTAPPNPAELLGSEFMTRVLDSVREQFDFVLIDSPPLMPVTDSVVLATKADAVVMVVKEGVWGRDMVLRALSKLDTVRARTLGAVLNCVDITSARRSSYYYYRDYYGGSYYGKAPSAGETAA